MILWLCASYSQKKSHGSGFISHSSLCSLSSFESWNRFFREHRDMKSPVTRLNFGWIFCWAWGLSLEDCLARSKTPLGSTKNYSHDPNAPWLGLGSGLPGCGASSDTGPKSWIHSWSVASLGKIRINYVTMVASPAVNQHPKRKLSVLNVGFFELPGTAQGYSKSSGSYKIRC